MRQKIKTIQEYAIEKKNNTRICDRKIKNVRIYDTKPKMLEYAIEKKNNLRICDRRHKNIKPNTFSIYTSVHKVYLPPPNVTTQNRSILLHKRSSENR